VAALTTAQVQVVTTAGIAALSTLQVAALNTSAIAALTTSQIRVLSSASVAALTTSQVVSLETTDIEALKTTQVVALTTAQVAVLTTSQIEALTTTQVEAMTTTQFAALTTAQVQGHLALGTPVILDLNGNGVETLSISRGVEFDLFATGNRVNTGWVGSSDGLLVMDRNLDGQINDGSELFGSSTSLASGGRARDGYAALRELDGNQDGVISSLDAAFADLQVWVDSNSDGQSGTGELQSLDSLGISSISTQASVDISKDSGNFVGLVSTYQTNDGQTHASADVWFVADKDQAPAESMDVDAAIAALSQPAAAVQIAPVASESSVDASTGPVTPVDGATQGEASGLRTLVSGLAQAISSFDHEGAGVHESSDLSSGAAEGSKKASSVLASVVSMVDTMKQFDADGNLVARATPAASTLVNTSSLKGALESATGGLLASPVTKLPG
jgi:hypothetical protein